MNYWILNRFVGVIYSCRIWHPNNFIVTNFLMPAWDISCWNLPGLYLCSFMQCKRDAGYSVTLQLTANSFIITPWLTLMLLVSFFFVDLPIYNFTVLRSRNHFKLEACCRNCIFDPCIWWKWAVIQDISLYGPRTISADTFSIHF